MKRLAHIVFIYVLAFECCGNVMGAKETNLFIALPVEQNLPSVVKKKEFLDSCFSLKLITKQYRSINEAYADETSGIVQSKDVWLIKDGKIQGNTTLSTNGSDVDGLHVKAEIPLPINGIEKQYMIELVADIRACCYYRNAFHTGMLRGETNIARHEYALSMRMSNNGEFYMVLNRWYKAWDPIIVDTDIPTYDLLKRNMLNGVLRDLGNAVMTNEQSRMYYISDEYLRMIDPSDSLKPLSSKPIKMKLKSLLDKNQPVATNLALEYVDLKTNHIILRGNAKHHAEMHNMNVLKKDQSGGPQQPNARIIFGLMGDYWREQRYETEFKNQRREGVQ